VQPTDFPDVEPEIKLSRDFAERIAREKAEAVFRVRPNDFVLGPDTIVVVDGTILGKPRDSADAARMLRLLSRRAHQVISGVCLMGPEFKTGSQDIRSEPTLVTMAKLSDEDIRSYIATEEPLDKAGAYGIQGMASRWIPRIEGDYFNVVGLPVALVRRMLHDHGVK